MVALSFVTTVWSSRRHRTLGDCDQDRARWPNIAWDWGGGGVVAIVKILEQPIIGHVFLMERSSGTLRNGYRRRVRIQVEFVSFAFEEIPLEKGMNTSLYGFSSLSLQPLLWINNSEFQTSWSYGCQLNIEK